MFGLQRMLAFAVLALLLALPCARAQDNPDALDKQFQELYAQGKFAEALPIAERYAELIKVRDGEAHPEYAVAMNNLAHTLKGLNRLAEAEAAYRKALAIDETRGDAGHEDLAADLRNLGEVLVETGRYPEAEPLYRRMLAIDEARLGPSHEQVGDDLNELAQVLKQMNRLSEAHPMMQRALEIAEAALGPQDPEVAIRLNNLAALLLQEHRIAEAEAMMRRALEISEASFGPDHEMTGLRIGNLAQILAARNEMAEAERLTRRALAISEAKFGPNHPRVAHDLSNLAALLRKTERLAEAEPLMRRALAIEEAAVGPDHPRVAVHLNNLAQVLVASGRAAEAEPLMRRSLAIDEMRFGPNHPNVARNLNNLAQLLKDIDRMEESEPMLQRALTILESNYGPNHPSVAELLSNLALLYKDRGRMDDAEKAMRRTLAIFEAGLGPEHPHVAIGLGNLALLRAERGDWADALNLTRRSAAIRTADIRRNAAGSPEATQRFALASSGDYKFLVLSNYRSRAATREGLAESFLAAQRALATDTAAALAQASARFAAGSGGLAETVRAMQDASRQREAADQQLLAALAKGDAPATSSARAEQAKLDAKLDEIAARLAKDYPDYAGLANPEPLSIEAVQRLLKPDEALVQFLSLPAVSTLPESGFVWVITKTEARWAQLRHGQVGLSAWVSVLRCGLDATLWTDASNWPETTEDDRRRRKEQTDKRTRCTTLMQMDARDDEPPPFDLSRAHELYTMLFGPIEETIKGKQLLIVPSGALTSLPFQTLVTAPPAVAIPESGADYARAAWLGQRQALTVLPSVASLSGLRGITRTSRAQEPFAGFGNPLLTGPFGGDNSAFAKQSCAKPGMETRPLVAMRAPSVAGVDLADVETLRRQSPLPETADELCAVSSMLGATPASVHLGQDATEETVKRLSQDGSLAKAQIVHFATHGLLAGETQQVASAVAEPALLLTPPDKGTETDDGLLTASEVAQLQLDADWVVLSACNTATASETGAEDLSGLARAFFYAGARALLVSHWYVDSTATVALITRTFAALKADPRIGRAEALRRAMTGLLTEPGRGHPAKWAPFVVVGEGGASAR